MGDSGILQGRVGLGVGERGRLQHGDKGIQGSYTDEYSLSSFTSDPWHKRLALQHQYQKPMKLHQEQKPLRKEADFCVSNPLPHR